MKRRTIAEHAKDYLVEHDRTGVMWGDCDLLDDIAARAGIVPKNDHPLIRWQRVLDGLERAPNLFKKGYITVDVFRNGGSRKVRAFMLVGDTA